MRKRLTVSCPFCGGQALWSANEERLCGCVAWDCPIKGVLMTKEQWEKRA